MAAPERTDNSSGLSGRAEHPAGETLDLGDRRPHPAHVLVAGPVEAAHRPVAAEDLGGDDEGRRHLHALAAEHHQVEALVAQVDEVVGALVLGVQAADRLFRVVGHEQVEGLLVEQVLLRLQGVDHLADEVVQVLQAEGGGDQVAEEHLGEPQDVLGHVFVVPEGMVAGEQVVPADLRHDDRQVVLVDVGVVGVDDVLDPLGQAAHDVEVLGVGEAADADGRGEQADVGVQPPAADAVDLQGPVKEAQTLEDADEGHLGDET